MSSTSGGTCTPTSVGFFTTGQVARRIGCSDDTVRRRILAGKIPAQRPGDREWRVPKAWVGEHLAPIKVIRRKPQ